jgi:ribosome maturation factor RimP
MNHIKLSWPSDHARLLKQYHLEVSTPGIERFLLTSAHFEAAIGQMVRLVYSEGTKTKTAKGELASYKDGILALKIKAEPLMVDIQSIVTCNLIHDIKVQHEKS